MASITHQERLVPVYMGTVVVVKCKAVWLLDTRTHVAGKEVLTTNTTEHACATGSAYG